MEKVKGIVMRSSNRTIIICTEKGDFLEIPTPKDTPQVGQTIEVSIKPKHLLRFDYAKLRPIAAAAMLLMTIAFAAFYYLLVPNLAVASVALDLDKGIELILNRDGKVINIQDVKGGSNLLDGITVQGMDVYQAVNLILDNANNKGTLNPTTNLVMASIVPLNRWGTEIVDRAKLEITIRDEMLSLKISGNILVAQTDQKAQKEAQQHGMTVNTHLVFNRCQEQGVNVYPEALQDNVQKALIDAKVDLSSLFPNESIKVTAFIDGENSEESKQHAYEQTNSGQIDEYKQSLETAAKQSTEQPKSKEHSTFPVGNLYKPETNIPSDQHNSNEDSQTIKPVLPATPPANPPIIPSNTSQQHPKNDSQELPDTSAQQPRNSDQEEPAARDLGQRDRNNKQDDSKDH